MSNVQLLSPNLTVTGKAGWCLSVTQDVWGVPHIYAKAIDAWNANNGNHPNEQPPSDVCVVVYWSYIEGGVQYGHIATWVPGRGVYSSPFDKAVGAQWFGSIQAVTDRINQIAGANSVYLGWSETLSGVQLITKGEDMVPTIDLLNSLFRNYFGRIANSQEAADYVGKITYDQLIPVLDAADEHTAYVNAAQMGKTALAEDWSGKIASLQGQVATDAATITDTQSKLADATAQVAQLGKAVDIKQNVIDKLTAQLATVNVTPVVTDTTPITPAPVSNYVIWGFITSVFNKLFNKKG